MAEVIYRLNDNLLELDGLQNAADDSYLNAASVSVTLKDDACANVSGQTWPTTLDYVAGSNGKYRATLTDSLDLAEEANYVACITADGGEGLRGYWELPVIAAARKR